MEKEFKGKAIYNPSGRAKEYSYWACNFYTGCSNDCQYCYCKKSVMASTWSNSPKLKKCFRDETHALEVFKKELETNLPALQKYGLFFSFTSDPMILEETAFLTFYAAKRCLNNDVPVKILTKNADFLDRGFFKDYILNKEKAKKYFAFGFTLTGHDELEPHASTNAMRINAMRSLHKAGFKTWASIEPVIDFESSKYMISESGGYCNLYKVGLQSGRRYENEEIRKFIKFCTTTSCLPTHPLWYFKDSLLQQAGINRAGLPANCVGRDYNIWDAKK